MKRNSLLYRFHVKNLGTTLFDQGAGGRDGLTHFVDEHGLARLVVFDSDGDVDATLRIDNPDWVSCFGARSAAFLV